MQNKQQLQRMGNYNKFPTVTITFHPSSSTLWCRLRLAVPNEDDDEMMRDINFVLTFCQHLYSWRTLANLIQSASNARMYLGFV